MKTESADGQNESTESPWPRVPRITSEEFQQSVAVAQLAVKLCELERANPTVKQDDKPNLRPEKFLDDSWKLIEKAREHVLRSESCEEYLARHDGSLEAGEAVVRRIVQDVRISFQKLCDPKRNEGDSELIRISYPDTGRHVEVEWKVFVSERGFEKLFWRYWSATSGLKNKEERERSGRALLISWKRDGIRVADFLALDKFRREHDKRVANLTKTSKQKQ